jgi:hypothetical protein
MPKRPFLVKVASIREIHDMPGTWSDADYRQLLLQLEVEGLEEVVGNDLFEMTLMALQDMESDDAADAVLAVKLGQDISSGARQNLVQDLLQEQRPWEEASNIRLHARIFAAAVLLQKALPKIFARPDMMRLVLEVHACTPEAVKLLAEPPQAAFVTRMLADAMDSHSILERLFDEQLAAQHFDEAAGIIWLAEFDRDGCVDTNTANLTVYSSEHWLESMRTISEFESSAYNDAAVRETEHE